MVFMSLSQMQAQKVQGGGGASGAYGNTKGSGIEPVPYDKISWRLNPPPSTERRYETKIPSLDALLGGGLPIGLSVVWGNAGSGKSLLARQIAIKAPKALYICCEVLSDAPSRKKYPNVIVADYTKYVPKYDKAINELFSFILELKPDVVVIDSLTTFLGESKLSVSEGSVREAVWTIHKNSEGICPIIGISEVRGSGFNEYTAGGKGVMHGCSMLVRTDKNVIRWESQLPRFVGSRLGDVVYTLEIQKDKHGLSKTTPMVVAYDKSSGSYDISEFKRPEDGELKDTKDNKEGQE